MRFYGNNTVFNRASTFENTSENCATSKGVTLKTILSLIVTFGTVFVMMIFQQSLAVRFESFLITGVIIIPILTSIISLIMIFVPSSAQYLILIYSLFEGISIGTIGTVLYWAYGFLGGMMVCAAFAITVVIFLVSAILYATGVVKVTSKLRSFVLIMMIGLIFTSFIFMLIRIFNYEFFTNVIAIGRLGLIISIVTVIISSIYSLLAINEADRLIELGMPKKYEAYISYGIILSIIWLFYSILELIIRIIARSDR